MEKKNRLFQIQDSDRPMWVIAESWNDALVKWKALIAVENDMSVDEVTEPNGIMLVCESDELLT